MEMEIDSRLAFNNDHTYLKTDGLQQVEGCVHHIRTENPTAVIPAVDLSSVLFTTTNSQQSTMVVNEHKTVAKIVNTLSIPNSNVFFIPKCFNFSLPSNTNISQNNVPIQKVNIGKYKSCVRPIQPKIESVVQSVPSNQIQSNVLHVPSTALNTKLQNLTPKKSSLKPILLHVATQEKPVIKHITPIVKKDDQNNKVTKDYENWTCTIKLSTSLLKRIQSGEKLFMCMECDEIYTEHKDLLKHQITHDKCDQKVFVQEHEKKKKVLVNNVQNKTIVEDKKNISNDNNSFTKEIKPVFRSSVNPKKKKVIFQGECIMCHSVFPDLGKHIKTVHQNSLNQNKADHLDYHCYKCNMTFDIKQQLRAHELSAHKPVYTYTCEHCLEEFSYKEHLEAHLETHCNDSIKYLCPYCDAGFPHSNGLRAHLVKHIGLNGTESSAFEMPSSQIEYSPMRPPEQLDQLFAELDNISDNVHDVYIEKLADDNYQVGFKAKDNENNTKSPLDLLLNNEHQIDVELKTKVPLENNIVNESETPTLSSRTRISYTVCRICMNIVSYSRIGRHMKKKHNNAAPYQCEICYAEFNRKHIMDDHRRKHTNNKPHKCVQCSKCFTYKHHLNRHMMIVHNAESLAKPFKCSVCDKAFSFKEYLTLHVNSRHKGKHYMCQICGKSFSTNAALNKHQLCHTDERPFMCEHCGRTFKCKTHCDTHKKNVHLGDPQLALPQEKFECNMCNKKFSTKVYRDMHFKRHNGQGHQCEICYKLFVSKAHMQRHIKIMHQI